MTRRSVSVILFPIIGLSVSPSFAQPAAEQVSSPSVLESPAPAPLTPPTPLTPQTPPQDEDIRPEYPAQELEDAVILLGELRENARTFPESPEARLKLAEGLYRIGDHDAAIEECRVAIKLKPDYAKAHLQLGVVLMAKQDWRAASSVLKEAIRLAPELTHAYYSLGSVQYSLGNIKAAIQSYRQTLELQPYFPDARYRLALLLKLTKGEQEAAQLMEEAAIGGVPQAQFFLGNAYKSGQGVEKNQAQAIFWWTKAVEFGHQPAADALSKLRRQALSPDQSDRRRKETLDAFRVYRDKLWDDFPDYSRTDDNETLGTRLLKQNSTDRAVSVLLKESYALSDEAQAELATLYESGWNRHLAPFDKKILTCFETTAAEGFLPAKKILARIYGKGLGMEPDLPKAKSILKGLPKQEMKPVLDELGLQ
jgi:TPR repeat protein